MTTFKASKQNVANSILTARRKVGGVSLLEWLLSVCVCVLILNEFAGFCREEVLESSLP